MKQSIAAVTCAAALVASLAACGTGDDKSAPPSRTGGTSQPATTPTTPLPTGTKSGPAALPAQTTYTYGGLKVVVNLPADIPSASRPSLRFFNDFLQARGRTTARNKLDPSLSGLASAHVLKSVQTALVPGSVQGIGSVTYTVSEVRTAGSSGYAAITGCLDQSKLSHVRKDGSHFGDASAKAYPTLKMSAEINPGPRVTNFAFAVGTC
jgi:hypothetical protein